MKTRKIRDGWDNPNSFIEEELELRIEDHLLRTRYKGCFYYGNIFFSFYVCQSLPTLGDSQAHMVSFNPAEMTGQRPAVDFGCRGEISIIDPETGFSLKRTGSSKKEYIKKSKQISSKRSGGTDFEVANKEIDVTVRKNIRTSRTDLGLIKETIERIAKKAYAEHEAVLVRKLGVIISPDMITPAQAYSLYCTLFFETRYFGQKKPSPKTLLSYQSTLKSLCYDLPPSPMGSITWSHLTRLFTERNFCDFDKGLLRSFWAFCLKNGYYIGKNPFLKPVKKKKRTPEFLHQGAATPESLELEECNKVFHYCMKQVPFNGLAYAVALTMFGGFSNDNALNKKWGDVIFSSIDPDDVRIIDYNDTAAGATHNRTCPLLLQGARILKARYQHLCTIYAASKLADMRIVEVKNKMQSPVESQLIEYYDMILRQSGIAVGEYSVLKETSKATSKRLFRNTYFHLIDYECGLQNEFGFREYLRGNSLTANTSADHYIGYSSEDGQSAMVDLLHRVAPCEEIVERGIHDTKDSNGTSYTCWPSTTARQTVLTAEIIIPPSAIAEFSALHGVSGSLVYANNLQQNGAGSRESVDTSSQSEPSEGQVVYGIEQEKKTGGSKKKQNKKYAVADRNNPETTPDSTKIRHERQSYEGEQLSLF